jgi:hypothetical protein
MVPARGNMCLEAAHTVIVSVIYNSSSKHTKAVLDRVQNPAAKCLLCQHQLTYLQLAVGRVAVLLCAHHQQQVCTADKRLILIKQHAN